MYLTFIDPVGHAVVPESRDAILCYSHNRGIDICLVVHVVLLDQDLGAGRERVREGERGREREREGVRERGSERGRERERESERESERE